MNINWRKRRQIKKVRHDWFFKFFLASELGMTIQELTSKLTQEEYINWLAYYELKKEYEDKAYEDAKNKSRARKR